jgi:cytochrome P450
MTSGSPSLDDIRTPPARASLLLGPTLPALAARFGARLISKPRRFGKTVVIARHAHVMEALRRDLDFTIGPVNAERIREVCGDFILGRDRSGVLELERRALYAALRAVDLDAILATSAAEADRLIAAAGPGEIDAVEGYARLVAGLTARQLFGLRQAPKETFLEVARAVFAHTFLNLRNDKDVRARAIAASRLMNAWLEDEIARRIASSTPGDDMMGALIAHGMLGADGVRRTLAGMLVGSIDTTASAVAKVLAVLGRDPRLMASAVSDASEMTPTLGWCRESLRRWPHNPILIRHAASTSELAGQTIPAGSRVVLWTQAAMQDAAAFPDPSVAASDRPAAGYLHFGGELHQCAGRAVNDRQIPMLVGKLLARGVVHVGAISWAGPFPANLPIKLVSAR